MSKYKQTEIPSLRIVWENLSASELRKKVFEYYRIHISNYSVINQHLQIPIVFSNATGGRKLSFGGSIYIEKANLVRVLHEIARVAVYNNFGQRKPTDKPNVIGYMNFKAAVMMNGKKKNIRFSVQMRKDGKFYYNHEVNVIKNPTAKV